MSPDCKAKQPGRSIVTRKGKDPPNCQDDWAQTNDQDKPETKPRGQESTPHIETHF